VSDRDDEADLGLTAETRGSSRASARGESWWSSLVYPAAGFLVAFATLAGIAVRPRLLLEQNPLIGTSAPPLAFSVAANAPDGAQSRTLESLKGHAVLLDFWASWCGPCAMEAPVIDRVAQRFASRGLVVLGVNTSDTPDVVREYAAERKLGYQMVLDPRNKAQLAFGVSRLPTLILLDKDGKVHAAVTGVVDEAALGDMVTEAL